MPKNTALKSFIVQAPKLQGAKMGDNLKVVWANFSTLSWAVWLRRSLKCVIHPATSRVENLAQVLFC